MDAQAMLLYKKKHDKLPFEQAMGIYEAHAKVAKEEALKAKIAELLAPKAKGDKGPKAYAVRLMHNHTTDKATKARIRTAKVQIYNEYTKKDGTSSYSWRDLPLDLVDIMVNSPLSDTLKEAVKRARDEYGIGPTNTAEISTELGYGVYVPPSAAELAIDKDAKGETIVWGDKELGDWLAGTVPPPK